MIEAEDKVLMWGIEGRYAQKVPNIGKKIIFIHTEIQFQGDHYLESLCNKRGMRGEGQ